MSTRRPKSLAHLIPTWCHPHYTLLWTWLCQCHRPGSIPPLRPPLRKLFTRRRFDLFLEWTDSGSSQLSFLLWNCILSRNQWFEKLRDDSPRRIRWLLGFPCTWTFVGRNAPVIIVLSSFISFTVIRVCAHFLHSGILLLGLFGCPSSLFTFISGCVTFLFKQEGLFSFIRSE